MAAEIGDATVVSALTTYAGKSTVESGLAPKQKVLDVGVASLSNKASMATVLQPGDLRTGR